MSILEYGAGDIDDGRWRWNGGYKRLEGIGAGRSIWVEKRDVDARRAWIDLIVNKQVNSHD